MSNSTPEMAVVLQRLEKLERSNRWLKRTLVSLTLGAGLALLMAAQAPPRNAADARNVVFKDEQGKERIWLGVGKDGPALRFLDGRGNDRGSLRLASDALTLRVVNAEGQLVSGISVQDNGVAIVNYATNNRIQTGVDAILEGRGVLAR